MTAVQDSNTTAEYAFGYADVTPNGSPATYGDAVNPYTPYTSGKTGGDGFDLAWAVDISTGLPVNVTGKVFKYVRVYSAVLDNATFGETSTEVCGIFTTANGGTGSGAATSTVRLMNTNEEPVTLNQQAVTSVAAGQYFLNSSAEYTYINGVLSSDAATEYGAEISIAAGQKIQIITQNGTESPFITVLSAF